jgi:putative photosynthetic complex assembly protein
MNALTPGAAEPAPAPAHASTSGLLFPRWVPRVVGLLLVLLLASLALLRVSGFEPGVEPGAVLRERALRFADDGQGGVRVVDHASGRTLEVMRGEQGFLRGVLRGLARDRRQHEIGAEPPYLLSLREDGRLLITDPTTGRRIDLASFGPDNAAVFARWLPPNDTTGALKP